MKNAIINICELNGAITACDTGCGDTESAEPVSSR